MHPTVLRVTFNHNHPLISAHALSFRPVSQETKELFIELFRKGHTAASAHHWHETKLYLDGGEDHTLLADRAYNPTKSDISKREHGDDNGKGMFDKLQAEIDAYNVSCREHGGKAKVQGQKISNQMTVILRVILHQKRNDVRTIGKTL